MPKLFNVSFRSATRYIASSLFLLILFNSPLRAQKPGGVIPSAPREFRAVWIATVANIDWPSSKTLSTDQQKAELIRLFDLARAMNLNAVILQVRPQCDALYASRLEPWSEFLTGQMGRAPSPYYDPLSFAITEAHKRGLELHAWFNPYRAMQASATGPASAQHISVRRPDLAKVYGKSVWLDPGEPEVQKHSLAVVMDVVRRYDIDGVHFDDYFYPYKEKGADGHEIPFPDDPSWTRYKNSGGTLSRDNWRRKNVDDFVMRTYKSIKKAKPHVKFGVSPFGIWQPGYPPGIKGFNAYAELYADSLKWLRNGWIDYFTPQLYWAIDRPNLSYTALLDWWTSNNPTKRHIWPGNAAYSLPANEIVAQIAETRKRNNGAPGNVMFSAKPLVQDKGGIRTALTSGVYAQPALVPATPWLGSKPPARPVAVWSKTANGETKISWRPRGQRGVFQWVVYLKTGDEWDIRILPGNVTRISLENNAEVAIAAVSGVDRLGNESERIVITAPSN